MHRLKTAALLLATTLFGVAIAPPAKAEWDLATMNAVVDGLNEFWAETMWEYGFVFTPPEVYIHNTAEPTPCGPSAHAHYCIGYNTIHLNMPEMTNLAYGIGDSAAYFIFAHEYGHSVQDQLGLVNSGLSITALELQADCLAAIAFASADYYGLLDPGDVEEGMFSAFYHGDYEFQNPQHHGTPAQRAEAFAIGFTNPEGCFY